MYALGPTSFLSIITAILGLVLFLVVSPKDDRKRKLPPVPVRTWPLVGNILSLQENPRLQFKQWHKEHGDLFSLYFGKTLVVVVNGYRTIREVLVSKGTAFLDRPVMFANEVVGMGDTGLAFSSGSLWQETRATTISILRELGLGKNILSERILEDVAFLMERLVQMNGEATDVRHHVNVSITNVVCSILVGKRFSYENERFLEVIKRVSQLGACAKEVAAINYMPALSYLPGDLMKIRHLRKAVEGLKDFGEYCCKIASDGEDSGNGHGGGSGKAPVGESFISMYRRKQKQQLASGQAVFLDEQNLSKTVMDLIGAGTESSSATIAWCVLYLLHHPRVQEKLHEELDQVVGCNRRPSMADKLRLPYLEAVIKETQRLASVAPFSMMRATRADVVVGGYVIPKGTSVITNLDTVLHDPEIWGQDADQFRPERFLKPDGSVLHREEFIPFSMGRRNCLGMGLAQMQIFLFLSSMLQRFEFVAPSGGELPTLKETFGLIAVPSPFKVRCVDRTGKI